MIFFQINNNLKVPILKRQEIVITTKKKSKKMGNNWSLPSSLYKEQPLVRDSFTDVTMFTDVNDYLFIQDHLMFRYNHFPDDFSEMVDQCKDKLFSILKSKSSKERFFQMIEDIVICDFGTLDDEKIEDEVMDRLKDHLKSQSLEQICDGGNAFIKILKYLREEEESLLWFSNSTELDDEDADDWRRKVSHMYKDENSWWNLLIYARTYNLHNLEEYCRNQLFTCILSLTYEHEDGSPIPKAKDNLILHMNRSSEFSTDKDLFKLSILKFMFLDKLNWDEYSQKENWVTLNEGAIVGIRDNFEKFSHITNEDVINNVFHWCKEKSRSTGEAEKRLLNILGPGLI